MIDLLPDNAISQQLIPWQRRHGRSSLPWQLQGCPYHVWVSEVMLQQTQVTTVIDYFNRFIERFPSLDALAHAALEDVLVLWSGLGYYRRAKHLHQAAQQLIKQGLCHPPSDLKALQALPGIGRSTAGAIRSLGYKQWAPILDGNVKRVLARVYGVDDPINQSKTIHTLWHLAEHHTPQTSPHVYNQGLMDLGATICRPKQPLCDVCPLTSMCRTAQEGSWERIPTRTPPKAKPIYEKRWFWIQNDTGLVMSQRSPDGIWPNLWVFPSLDEALPEWVRIRQRHAQPLTNTQHVFTHQTWKIQLDTLPLPEASIPLQYPKHWQHVPWDDLSSFPTPAVVTRLISQMLTTHGGA